MSYRIFELEQRERMGADENELTRRQPTDFVFSPEGCAEITYVPDIGCPSCSGEH